MLTYLFQFRLSCCFASFSLAHNIAKEFSDREIYIYSFQDALDLDVCRQFEGNLKIVNPSVKTKIIDASDTNLTISSVSNLEYMIAMRYHACLVALKYGIKTMALCYDEKVSGKELYSIIKNINKADKNYKLIQKVKKEFIENLAIGISNLVNIFEPEAIGIGGSFVYFEDVLLDALKKELTTKNLLFNKREEINIQTAVLGNEAGIIGAIL